MRKIKGSDMRDIFGDNKANNMPLTIDPESGMPMMPPGAQMPGQRPRPAVSMKDKAKIKAKRKAEKKARKKSRRK
jgi:hypothetical protein